MTPAAKSEVVRRLGREVGFDLVGVTTAGPLPGAAYYREWLAAGYGAEMGYLRRNVPIREDPRKLVPGARSVVCVGLNYRREDGFRPVYAPDEQGARGEAPRLTGRVAQYARGRDYHTVVRGKLEALVERLRAELDEAFEARAFVDTGPVLERELAAAAGLGWIGKNTCLMNGRLGSYLFLGELITTLELTPDEPVAERCASCKRCIESCPTGALRGPGELDARRCISYLTIEARGDIAEELHAAMGAWVYGCDVCQQVCPYNARAPLATDAEVIADVTPAEVDLLELLRITSGDYRRLTRGSAARRARRAMWRRNAAIALGNVGGADEPAREALSEAAGDADGPTAAAAQASLRRGETG